jgi:FkbM family methyltransferase
MLPPLVDRILSDAPGSLGACYNAYKAYRWGDPYVRLIHSLADRSRLAVDVGAHLGDYTFFMRRYSSGCVAFECNPVLVGRLRRRFGQSVEIRSEAVSDREGTAELRIPQSDNGLGRATIETRNALGEFSLVDSVTVRTVSLDEAIGRPVGLIKVDVEGHEMAVLQGAARILADDRPNLLLEVEERHVPGCVAEVFDFLGDLGYCGAFLRDGGLVPVQPAERLGPGAWNYVFKHHRRDTGRIHAASTSRHDDPAINSRSYTTAPGKPSVETDPPPEPPPDRGSRTTFVPY